MARLKSRGPVQAGVQQMLKDHQPLPRIPLVSRSAERVERRGHGLRTWSGRNVVSRERSGHVIGDDRINLGQELGHGLSRATAHEVHQRVDELRPVNVHIGREAPREVPWTTT